MTINTSLIAFCTEIKFTSRASFKADPIQNSVGLIANYAVLYLSVLSRCDTSSTRGTKLTLRQGCHVTINCIPTEGFWQVYQEK